MTKSTITREENIQAVFDLKAGYTLGLADVEILKRVARMALAAMDSEPVAWRRFQETPTDGGYWILYDYRPNCSGVEPLYRHAQQPVVPDGYVMVPKEPTDEMLAAAKEWTGLTSTAEVVYIKMLAAAPQEVKGE